MLPMDSLVESLRSYVDAVISFNRDAVRDRHDILQQAVEYAVDRQANEAVEFCFICTHNSRRSHFAHIWAHTAARHYELPFIRCSSGGTETTACDPRTVAALRRAGLEISSTETGVNPHYQVFTHTDGPPIEVFSKIIPPDPAANFAAMMCCGDVDARCPHVPGADVRIPLHYQDPKQFDGTPEESLRYDERCLQIARDMFQLMAMIAASTGSERKTA